MTIRYKCEECGAALNIKDELAGTKGNCPRCKVEFIVPAPEGAAAGAASPQSPAVPSPVANEPAGAGKSRAGGAISEDEIEDILEGTGPSTSSSDSRVAVADNGGDEEDAPPRRGRSAEMEDDESGAEDADEVDDEDERRRRKKKVKRAGRKSPAESDSSESAAIARDLMARGERGAAREEKEKKGGRPFGGVDTGKEEGEGFTVKEVAKYLVTTGWPFAVGGLAIFGLCFWLSYMFWKGESLPSLATVTGTVTLDGEPLPLGAIVEFHPVIDPNAPNYRLATSVGFPDKDGKYTLIYKQDILGAVIGKHRVLIKFNDETGVQKLPPKYSESAKTILKAEVVKGGPPINFELTSDAEQTPPKDAASQ